MELFHKIFAGAAALVALVQMPGIPPQAGTGWQVTRAWESENGRYVFEAVSERAIQDCRDNPNGHIQFPTVDQSAHELFLDGKKIQVFSDPNFQRVRSYYGAPHVLCSEIGNAKEIKWRVTAYAKIFALIRWYPALVHSHPYHNVIAETLNAIVAGCLFMFGIFTVTIFLGKITPQLTASLAAACFFLSFYFAGTSTETLGISVPMFGLHKFAESCLWIGVGAYFTSLHLNGFSGSNIVFRFGLPALALGVVWILFAQTGDGIQQGSSLLMFPMDFVGMWLLVPKLRDLMGPEFNRRRLFEFLSLLSFLMLALNDGLVANGIVRGYMLMGVGMISGLFFFVLSMNEKINHTYRERDYLRAHLEEEVQTKSQELHQKTNAFEKAMHELEETQTQLVSLARLASLRAAPRGDNLNIQEVIDNMLALLRSKVTDKMTVRLAVPQDLQVFGSVHGNVVRIAVSDTKRGTSFVIEIPVHIEEGRIAA